MLKINHKSQDILKDFTKYIRNGGKFYASLKEFKTILIGITTEIGSDGTLYLEAEIQWIYSTSTMITEKFEYSEQGFVEACEWLDKMRLVFVEESLEELL